MAIYDGKTWPGATSRSEINRIRKAANARRSEASSLHSRQGDGAKAEALLSALRKDATRYRLFAAGTRVADRDWQETERRPAGGGGGAATLAVLALVVACAGWGVVAVLVAS